MFSMFSKSRCDAGRRRRCGFPGSCVDSVGPTYERAVSIPAPIATASPASPARLPVILRPYGGRTSSSLPITPSYHGGHSLPRQAVIRTEAFWPTLSFFGAARACGHNTLAPAPPALLLTVAGFYGVRAAHAPLRLGPS